MDALLSERVYKKRMGIEEALAIIEKGRGKYFEPCIVDAVMNLKEPLSEFLSIDLTEGI